MTSEQGFQRSNGAGQRNLIDTTHATMVGSEPLLLRQLDCTDPDPIVGIPCNSSINCSYKTFILMGLYDIHDGTRGSVPIAKEQCACTGAGSSVTDTSAGTILVSGKGPQGATDRLCLIRASIPLRSV